MIHRPTKEQLSETDKSEIVTSREEAEVRIRDLKDKARME